MSSIYGNGNKILLLQNNTFFTDDDLYSGEKLSIIKEITPDGTVTIGNACSATVSFTLYDYNKLLDTYDFTTTGCRILTLTPFSNGTFGGGSGMTCCVVSRLDGTISCWNTPPYYFKVGAYSTTAQPGFLPRALIVANRIAYAIGENSGEIWAYDLKAKTVLDISLNEFMKNKCMTLAKNNKSLEWDEYDSLYNRPWLKEYHMDTLTWDWYLASELGTYYLSNPKRINNSLLLEINGSDTISKLDTNIYNDILTFPCSMKELVTKIAQHCNVDMVNERDPLWTYLDSFTLKKFPYSKTVMARKIFADIAGFMGGNVICDGKGVINFESFPITDDSSLTLNADDIVSCSIEKEQTSNYYRTLLYIYPDGEKTISVDSTNAILDNYIAYTYQIQDNPLINDDVWSSDSYTLNTLLQSIINNLNKLNSIGRNIEVAAIDVGSPLDRLNGYIDLYGVDSTSLGKYLFLAGELTYDGLIHIKYSQEAPDENTSSSSTYVKQSELESLKERVRLLENEIIPVIKGGTGVTSLDALKNELGLYTQSGLTDVVSTEPSSVTTTTITFDKPFVTRPLIHHNLYRASVTNSSYGRIFSFDCPIQTNGKYTGVKFFIANNYTGSVSARIRWDAVGTVEL